MNNVVFDRETDQVIAINREVKLYEYEVKLPYPINLTKTVSEKTSNQIQKTDSDGNLLYKLNIIIDEFNNETYEETTESYIYNQDNEDEELELVQLEPIMIDEFVDKNYNFTENCSVFTYEEVLEGKIESINNNSLCSIVIYDEDFADNLFNYTNCSLGDGLIVIHPLGEVISKEIILINPTNLVEIYIESQSDIKVSISSDNQNFVDFINSSAKLSSASNTLYLKVTNKSTKNREVYAVGILV